MSTEKWVKNEFINVQWNANASQTNGFLLDTDPVDHLSHAQRIPGNKKEH